MENCQSGTCGSQDPAKQQQEIELKNTLSKIKYKLIVMSGKGGVGKTSVSVNLGMALAKKGFKVGIMDVDMHGPDVPRMMGLKGEVTASKEAAKLSPMTYSDNLKAISMECFMPNKDDAVIWRGPLKHSAINQFIADIDWGELDFLIVDSPPGTGDEPLSVAQTIPDAKVIIVTTPQEVALSDVRKSINFCIKINKDIVGMIENMSGYVCPHCGETAELFGTGGGEATAKQFNLNFLGKIPFDPKIVKAGDSGKSYQDEYSDAPAAKAFGNVVEKVVELLNA
ncbi:MAG: Mrp/NBP35 family ATP-binding protein [Desulfobacteraceae bacterium]|nr:Mrp/NBP35 family ATP-binding protein [Desulfobacteraceae bacterium]MBC2753989.1 Mrp/NBP35 family ATP-binding protein [Desulfobacteraceae bacterium]